MSELNFKTYNQLEVAESLSNASHVIIEENGDVVRFPANSIGKIKTVNGVEPNKDGDVSIEIPDGFSGSWNDLEDRPFGLMPTGGYFLSWDGNTDGLVSDSSGEYFKVCDSIVTQSDNHFAENEAWVHIEWKESNKSTFTFTSIHNNSSRYQEYENALVFCGSVGNEDTGLIVCVSSANTIVNGLTFSKPGIYFKKTDDVYAVQLRLTDTYLLPLEKQIDEKYIPYSIARVEHNHNWSSLDGRPFVTEEPIVVEWDGNTEGLPQIQYRDFYRISDITPTMKDFENGCTVTVLLYSSGEISTFEFGSDDIVYDNRYSLGADCIHPNMAPFFLVFPEDFSVNTYAPVSEKGLYFLNQSTGSCCLGLTINGKETINEGCIPDTIARISDIPAPASAIPNVTSTPTAEDFNALLASLRAAGYLAE